MVFISYCDEQKGWRKESHLQALWDNYGIGLKKNRSCKYLQGHSQSSNIKWLINIQVAFSQRTE